MTHQPSEQAVEKADLFDLSPERQALEMLDAFVSVGATRFDLTVKREGEKKPSYRPACSIEQLRAAMGEILRRAEERQKNVIVRPHRAQVSLIQLDDLDASVVQTIQPAAFLVLCTSPGNYQAWVAANDADEDFVRRMKKGVGSDPSASGATRIGGSLNCKAKYAPSFPRVENVHIALGRIVRQADLAALGVVAAPATTARLPPPRHASLRSDGPRRFPDYQRSLRDAPKRKGDSEPDRSKSDYFWCYLSAKWGWPAEAVADELMRVSTKAQEKGRQYALLTARNAAANAGSMAGGR